MAGIRHDRDFWRRAYREVNEGATVGDVARRLGVRPRTLTWWCWRLRQEGARPRRVRSPAFLPVVAASREIVTAAPFSDGRVELEVASVRVRVGVGTDVEYVAALVSAIRDAC